MLHQTLNKWKSILNKGSPYLNKKKLYLNTLNANDILFYWFASDNYKCYCLDKQASVLEQVNWAFQQQNPMCEQVKCQIEQEHTVHVIDK